MRLIDADALKKAINDNGCRHSHYFDVFDVIDDAPTVEKENKGEWIKWDFKTFGAMGDWEYKCSNCEKVYEGEYNFCPNCGADMRGDAK